MKRINITYTGLIFCCFHLIYILGVCQNIPGELNKIRTVVIDPGHGGKDDGASGKVAKEKDIVLAISLKVGKYIEENIPDVTVIYTRTTDVFIPLDERAKIANDADADLFISIHANSNPNHRPYGTETFAMGLHKTESNLEVAKKENSVIVFEDNYETKYEGFDPNDIESYIMISLMQDTYLEQSLTAASFVQDQFRDRAKRKDRGVKQAGFLVLWQTSMPSILVETGFLSNQNEEKYLISERGQDLLSSAIYRAFKRYKYYIEGNAQNANLTNITKDELTENEAEETDKPVKKDNTKDSTVKKVKNTDIDSVQTSKIKKTDIANVIFKVQILYSTSKIKLDNDVFKDFNDVEEIKSAGNFKYLVGTKTNYNEAIEYSKWVKNRHPDAFVVAVLNGEIIPLTDALKLIKTN